MTPKEKAISLYKSFYPQVQWKMGQEDCKDRAKQCALIAVDEIIKSGLLIFVEDDKYIFVEDEKYWEQVRQEIDKLCQKVK